ncbi:MAG: hypothetical protein AAF688_07470 [Bacteroidota bacterium]
MKNTRIFIVMLSTMILSCAKENYDKNEFVIERFIEDVLLNHNIDFEIYEELNADYAKLIDKEKAHNNGFYLENSIIELGRSKEDSIKRQKLLKALGNLEYSEKTMKLKDSIDEMISLSESDINQFMNVINLNDYPPKDEMINFYVTAFRLQYTLDSLDTLKILKHDELSENSRIKNTDVYKNLKLEEYHNVYYVVMNENLEPITFFIMDNNKISSFFPFPRFGSDTIQPYFLNRKDGI